MTLNKKTDKKDLNKTIAAITANVAHSLDASVLHLTLKNTKLSSVNTVHDAYQTHPDDCCALEQDVKASFVSVFVSTDILDDIYKYAIQAVEDKGLDPNKPITVKEGRRVTQLEIPKPPLLGT